MFMSANWPSSIDGKILICKNCLTVSGQSQRVRLRHTVLAVVVALVSQWENPTHIWYDMYSVHLDPINTFFPVFLLSVHLSISESAFEVDYWDWRLASCASYKFWGGDNKKIQHTIKQMNKKYTSQAVLSMPDIKINLNGSLMTSNSTFIKTLSYCKCTSCLCLICGCSFLFLLFYSAQIFVCGLYLKTMIWMQGALHHS